MRPLTIISYKSRIRQFLKWLNGCKPSSVLALEYLNYLKTVRKPNTVAISRNAIVKEFGWSIPSFPIEIPEPKYLSLEQIKLLISHSNNLEKALISLLFDTGARVSEILNLQTQNIDWQSGVITIIRKGGNKQNIAISDVGKAALSDWLKTRKSRNYRVFMDYEYSDIYGMFKSLGTRCGIRLRPHCLRHSRAVHLFNSGIPLERIADILGHKSIETTRRIYTALKAGDLRKFLVKW